MCEGGVEVMTLQLMGMIEGLLFVAGDEGLSKQELCNVLEIDAELLESVIKEMTVQYNDESRGIQLLEVAETYILTTKQEHAQLYKKLAASPTNSTLSQAALETLAIIAYNQPMTRVEIDEIRGVKSEKAIQTLLSKQLIKEIGRASGAGRAILYGTTKQFCDYFGLKSVDELPPLPEQLTEQTIEEEADLFFKTIDE